MGKKKTIPEDIELAMTHDNISKQTGISRRSIIEIEKRAMDKFRAKLMDDFKVKKMADLL